MKRKFTKYPKSFIRASRNPYSRLRGRRSSSIMASLPYEYCSDINDEQELIMEERIERCCDSMMDESPMFVQGYNEGDPFYIAEAEDGYMLPQSIYNNFMDNADPWDDDRYDFELTDIRDYLYIPNNNEGREWFASLIQKVYRRKIQEYPYMKKWIAICKQCGRDTNIDTTW